jgi:hypothetical protein
MIAKPISNHVAVVLSQMGKVETLTREQRVQIVNELYAIMKAIQRGDIIIDPLYPDTDRLTPIVAEYIKTLKPSDVLDDPPSLIPFAFRG